MNRRLAHPTGGLNVTGARRLLAGLLLLIGVHAGAWAQAERVAERVVTLVSQLSSPSGISCSRISCSVMQLAQHFPLVFSMSVLVMLKTPTTSHWPLKGAEVLEITTTKLLLCTLHVKKPVSDTKI